MRILAVHADYIEVEPKKMAIKDAEALTKEGIERFEEVLVVFTAVEEGDDEAIMAERLAQESIAVADQVKTKNILIYPLVHLTSKPSKPSIAKNVVVKAEALLKERGSFHYDILSNTWFGWFGS